MKRLTMKQHNSTSASYTVPEISNKYSLDWLTQLTKTAAHILASFCLFFFIFSVLFLATSTKNWGFYCCVEILDQSRD